MDQGITICELVNAFNEREKEGIEDPQNEPFYGLALAGETGEYCNLVKKRLRGDLDNEELNEKELEEFNSGTDVDVLVNVRYIEHERKEARELADIVLYVAKICQIKNIDLDPYIQEKFNKYSDKIQSNVKI